ncbi:hypothetical protein M9H77_18207 [Catharanthus roseus]|uniref:Uncharacterized protein n=1 Tax=Catharanthus roseus TaxID=4058 RepID=A0ACC0B6T0_CATRO|nr:hypothetical protein M9H77_18207 [Catharanthus roseus]
MFDTAPQDSSYSTHGYSHAEYSVSSSVPYVPRPADRVCEGGIGFEGDRGVGEEQGRVGSLHIEGEADERGDDDGDGGDDDQDEGDDGSDEEQPVPVAPVAHASRSDGCPRHGKVKGLTDSFMSVMSKIVGSRNKRPEVACEVLGPTQKRKKVKPSDWEQTKPAEGGPIDPKLIPSYSGHVADCASLKFRSCYMALTGWELTDAHVRPLASGSGLTHLRSPTRTASTCHGDDLGLALTGGLGFNVAELHAVATSRQTSLSPRDASSIGRFAWGAACLAYLYRNLGQASRIDAKELAGHPRIQNPGNISSGFHLPVAPIMPPQTMLDLIAREANREDVQDSELGCTVRDLLRKHYRAP